MAKSKSRQIIPPFPEAIDRDYFGAWLSGFTDGEGCFYIGFWRTRKEKAGGMIRFRINLRADEQPIVLLIQSYFQCGRVTILKNGHDINPKVDYVAVGTKNLIRSIVPHFDKFPLMAKKSRDFAIWREAVILANKVFQRPQAQRGGGRGSGRGLAPKWTEDERSQFNAIALALRQQRAYQSSKIELPRCAESSKSPGLFDHLEEC